jgi:uncharacterized protein Usg
MKYSDYLNGRLIQKVEKRSFSKNEISFLNYVFDSSSFLKSNYSKPDFQNSLKILGNNFFYDIYKFEFQDRSYAIKMGSAEDFFIFQKEKETLELVQDFNLSPKFIHIEKNEDYSFLLVSYEHGFPVKDFGMPHIQNSIPTIASNLSYMHEKTVSSSKNDTSAFLTEIYDFSDFEEILDKEVFEDIRSISVYPKLCKFFNFVKDSLSYQIIEPKTTSLCHLNLTPSTILSRDGMIKFINFHKSYYLNPLFDVAFLCIKTNISSSEYLEKEFIKAYVHYHSNLNDFEKVYASFLGFKEVSCKIILYEMCCNYIYELILLDDTYPHYDYFNIYQTIKEISKDELTSFIPTLDYIFGTFKY